MRQRAEADGLSDRLTAVTGSMDDLPFAEQSLDVIWSEGAIYNIGFRRGLALWHRYLKPGGFVAVTEATWLTDSRPAEIETFWHEAYAEIDTTPHKLQAMQDAGFRPVATFILPERCWTEEFYEPQREAQRLFLDRHAGNTTAEGLVANMRREAAMYARYKQYYGYVFYIGQKPSAVRPNQTCKPSSCRYSRQSWNKSRVSL